MPNENRVGRTLGLDVGGSAIKWLVLAGDDVEADGKVPTPTGGADLVAAALVDLATTAGDVDAIGVGIPGHFTPEGVTTLIPNVPGDWDGFPLAARVADRLGRPVVLANDARAFTLAELRHGAGRQARDLVAVVLGTGVGGGVAAGGRVVLGQGGTAGEVGHQLVDPLGPRCGCGARGCVEVFASGPAIRAGGVRAILQGLPTSLRESCGNDVGELTTEMVLDAARDGDPHARDVVERAGRALGFGIANLCNVLAPEIVVVGGGVAAGLDVLQPSIVEVLEERALSRPELARATVGPVTGALGAALWARERPDLEERS